jgi:hypothetical protein
VKNKFFKKGINSQETDLFSLLFFVFFFLLSQTHKMLSNSATTASPTSRVFALPPISMVRTPASITLRTAVSMALASAGRLSEYWSIMAMERMAATGFTRPLPAMSGAEPDDYFP